MTHETLDMGEQRLQTLNVRILYPVPNFRCACVNVARVFLRTTAVY